MAKKQSRQTKRIRPKIDSEQYKEMISQMLRDVEGLQRMQNLQSRLTGEIHRRLRVIEKMV